MCSSWSCVLLRLIGAGERSCGDGERLYGECGGGVGVLLLLRIPGVDRDLEIEPGAGRRMRSDDEEGFDDSGINEEAIVGEGFGKRSFDEGDGIVREAFDEKGTNKDGECIGAGVGVVDSIVREAFDEEGTNKDGECIGAGVGVVAGDRAEAGNGVRIGKEIERVI